MKLWSSLLFLHGHIADPALARSLAGVDDPQAGPRPDDIDTPSPRLANRAPPRPCVPFKRGAITAACSVALSPFR